MEQTPVATRPRRLISRASVTEPAARGGFDVANGGEVYRLAKSRGRSDALSNAYIEEFGSSPYLG
jgi:hypothetical protein